MSRGAAQKLTERQGGRSRGSARCRGADGAGTVGMGTGTAFQHEIGYTNVSNKTTVRIHRCIECPVRAGEGATP
ncbi:hypothetical protein KTU01_21760 [Kocuria turfanensis]|uniref:Uncharacterized protein n=1 Tax=Kocuria turfanensis TaxID=388357 RepID=A0A512IED1_9MICC|nr:hypothetical protein KTU01_21760 [Kocuria turfanensis]